MSNAGERIAAIAPELQRALVEEASLAPSVHNVQPARWRFGDDGWLACFHDRERSLPHGDPTGRDIRVSIGAAVEGMAIAAGRNGYALEVHHWGDDPERVRLPGPLAPPAGMRVVAALRLSAGGTIDPLAAAVPVRHSWRGPFERARERAPRVASEDLIVIDETHGDLVARIHDAATWHFERQPAYHAELWKWLRLSPRHRNWSRDGLNADALALSRVERTAASLLLRPRVFALLGRLGVARFLVSESAVVRSAAAFLVFAPPAALDDWTVGRRFYRAWLEATAAGLSLAPMSALADWEVARAKIVELATVPADRRVVNVFRTGRAPASRELRRARIPAAEMLV